MSEMKNIIVETEKGKVNCPCFDVIMVPIDKVQANNYNPNSVSGENMKLLEQSIIANGINN